MNKDMDRRVGVDVDNDVDVNVNLAMEVFTKMDMDTGIQEPKVAEWEDSDRTLEQLKNSESRETSLF